MNEAISKKFLKYSLFAFIYSMLSIQFIEPTYSLWGWLKKDRDNSSEKKNADKQDSIPSNKDDISVNCEGKAFVSSMDKLANIVQTKLDNLEELKKQKQTTARKSEIQNLEMAINNLNKLKQNCIITYKAKIRLPQPLPESAYQNPSVALSQYLSSFSSPLEIQELAQRGFINWHRPETGLLKGRKEGDKAGGRINFRDWINRTFSESEDTLVKRLGNLPPPHTWSLEELEEVYKSVTNKKASQANPAIPTFTLVKGVSANFLPESPLAQNSFMQLASQFNFLEAVSAAMKSKVADYPADNTQGPQAAIEAAAATLYREAVESSGKLKNAVADVLPENAKYYRNGYINALQIPAAEQNELLKRLTTHINKLRILPQWVECEVSKTRLVQVFTAAPSYQGGGIPSDQMQFARELCNILVVPQYAAIAKLAVIRNVRTKQPVNVHLTLIGQDSFKNPPEVMKAAFAKVAEIVKNYPQVQVYIHAYSAKAQEIVHSNITPSDFNIIEMTKEEFMKGEIPKRDASSH